MVESVQVAVILNEKQASVLFPTQKGETDMNMMFVSRDPIFHECALTTFVIAGTALISLTKPG